MRVLNQDCASAVATADSPNILSLSKFEKILLTGIV